MNTKLLKQKILDLAIRGKLTQQLKSDGTAADLLKEICDRTQEKTSLRAKRGNPSPQTIIPLDKNEAPFEIPVNWEWVRLNQITELIEDCPHSTACDEGAGYPLIRTPNIGFGHLILEGVHRVSEDVYRRRNLRATPQPNDLIFAREAPAGNIAVIKDGQEVCLGQRTVLVRPLRNILCSYYLAYYILSSISQKRLVECSGGSTVAHVNLSVFRSYEVPLPPLAEQQRIVEKIEEAFAEIDAVEKNKELLKTHIKQTRQKILDLAIHGKLVPQNKSDEPASVLLERITRDNPHYEKLTDAPFEIPDSWEWVKLGDVAALKGGKRVPAGKTMTTEPTSHIYIRVTDMRDGTIYDDDLHYITDEIYEVIKNYTISKKDLYITIAGTIGRVGLVPDFFDGMNLTENALKVTEITIEKKYLMFVLQSRFVQEYFESTYHQVAMPKLSLVNASKAVIPLPPLAEQKRIVDRIEEIFASLDEISLHLV